MDIAINRYALCNQQAEVEKARKREAAKAYRHKFQDPFFYLDETETPYTKQGSIAIQDAKDKLWSQWQGVHDTERIAIVVMYYVALMASSKIIYLETALSEPVTVTPIPRIELALHPRYCAVCATKTSSGIRALCDSCHQRFILDGNFKNTPLTFDDVSEAILRSDTRHRANVQAKIAA